MLGIIGSLLVGFAFVASLYTTLATLFGLRRRDKRWLQSARNALYAASVLLGVALLALGAAFLTHHFEIRYVAQHTSRALPLYLKISAVWAGQEGSLLVWSFLQALFAALAVGRANERARPLVPWATVVLGLITAFFTGVTLFTSNPFAQWSPPLDGQGLNPLLRHPGMIFHPPALYVGYVGLAVPFAFAVAALTTGRVAGWTRAVRTWTLVAWLGLGLGLLLGMRWAYDVLGWGGYWGWDPVENAGLMPWLTATAFLHGAVMQEERRGFRIWNFLLVTISFALVLFGTYATRSGAIQSVHAYARSNLGAPFLGAIGVTLVTMAGLLIWRRSAVAQAGARLGACPEPTGRNRPELVFSSCGRSPDRATNRAQTEPTSLLSRDGAFFLTLVLFSTLTLSIFVGSVLPTLTQALAERPFEAGPAWFDRVTGPQLAALLVLLGLCPLLGRAASTLRRLRKWGWLLPLGAGVAVAAALLAHLTRPVSLIGFAIVGLAATTALLELGIGTVRRSRRTGDPPLNALWLLFRTQRRKYGGYLIHLGVILMGVGIIGTRLYPFEKEVILTTGVPEEVGRYTLAFEDLRGDFVGAHAVTWASVAVREGDDYLTTLTPRLDRYANYDQNVAVPAVHVGLREDLYLILAGWDEQGQSVTLKVMVNVLVNFLWLGGLVFLAGGVLALWPPIAQPAWGHYLTVGVVLGLFVGAGWAMWGAPHGTVRRDGARPLVGEEAPDFTLTLLDGSTFSLAAQRGRVTIVNFWASWCPPCEEELPDLQATWEAFRDEEVTLVGVAFQEQEATVREAIADYGLTYSVGLDAGERISGAYGVSRVPETFVVGPDGRVAYVHVGPVTAEVLVAEIDALKGQE